MIWNSFRHEALRQNLMVDVVSDDHVVFLVRTREVGVVLMTIGDVLSY